MLRVLFICHGNICHSPMAEMIMKELVRQKGLEAKFEISSMAATTEEMGHDIYPPAKRTLTPTTFPIPKEKPPSLQRETTDGRTTSSPWTRKICMTFPALPTAIRIKKSPAFLTGQEKQGMWRTPGIREILRKPMRISKKAAGRCWRSFPEPLLPLTDSGPRERNESEKFLFHVTSLYFRTGFLLSIFSRIKVRPGSLRNTQKTGKMRFL